MMELQTFAENIWVVDGPTVRAMGLPFPTRMVVVKLDDGSLWINSPIDIARVQAEELNALGPVRYLVAPTRLHVWRLEKWATFFPDAQLWGPPRIPHYDRRYFQHVLDDEAPAAWASALDQMVFRGSFALDEVYFLHKPSRTLIFGDFIQNYPPRPNDPVFNLLLKAGGLWGGGVGIDIRATFIGHCALGRASREKLLAWDFDAFIPAHGACLKSGAKSFVRRAFNWLGNERGDNSRV